MVEPVKICKSCMSALEYCSCDKVIYPDMDKDDDILTETFGPMHDGKADGGKPDIRLFDEAFPYAQMAVADVLTYGLRKYGKEGSWRTVPDAVKRYTSAMRRHQLALASGELMDKESSLPHAAHIAWNAMALLELAASK